MNTLRIKVVILLTAALLAIAAISAAATINLSSVYEQSLVEFLFRPGGTEDVSFTQSPRKLFPILAVSYVTLVVLVSVLISLVVANMVFRPLYIFQRAVSRIGPDGVIPRFDEEGLGENLEAIKVLNRLSDRSRDALESRMRLVAAAGHDLRTPMTRMRLRAEFLEEEDRKGWLKDIAELEAIAESAIDLVKEETAREDHEPLDLGSVVQDVVSDLKAINLAVDVRHSEQAVVFGCAPSLKRAISNLVSNAARHGKEAHVSVTRKGDGAHVIIEDFGPGIPEDKIEMAFEPFFRVDPSRAKKIPGAGLGLSIARSIIHKHEGEIELMNKPGGGGLLQHIHLPLIENAPA